MGFQKEGTTNNSNIRKESFEMMMSLLGYIDLSHIEVAKFTLARYACADSPSTFLRHSATVKDLVDNTITPYWQLLLL